MKYYTFLPRFHAAIRHGIKVSTIRGKPKAVCTSLELRTTTDAAMPANARPSPAGQNKETK